MPFNLPYSFQYSSIPATNQSYGWLRSSVPAYLGRQGDTLLDARFDDFLMGCERRLYYGCDTPDRTSPLFSEPLRVAEMEAVDEAFALQATTPWPLAFLELIAVRLNEVHRPLQVVPLRALDAYCDGQLGGPRVVALAGQTFRVKDDPRGALATLRYFRRPVTPTPAVNNAILAAYPDLYLNACLIEASIFIQDEAAAVRYAGLYNAAAAGLVRRAERIANRAVQTIRVGGRTP